MSTVNTINSVVVNYFNLPQKIVSQIKMMRGVLDKEFPNAEIRQNCLNVQSHIDLAKSMSKNPKIAALRLVEITVTAIQYKRTPYAFLPSEKIKHYGKRNANDPLKGEDKKVEHMGLIDAEHSVLGGRWSPAWYKTACTIMGIVEEKKVEPKAEKSVEKTETKKEKTSKKGKKGKKATVEVTVGEVKVESTPPVTEEVTSPVVTETTVEATEEVI